MFWFVKQNLSTVLRTFINSEVMQLVCTYIALALFPFFFLFSLTIDSHKKNWIVVLNHKILDQYITFVFVVVVFFFFFFQGHKIECILYSCSLQDIQHKRKEIESLLSHFVLNKYQITSLLLVPNPLHPKKEKRKKKQITTLLTHSAEKKSTF